MKRLIIGLTILATLLFLCLAISASFCMVHRPIADGFEKAAALAADGDRAQAIACAEAAAARWETYHNFTAAFADHTPMDEADALLAELRVYAQAACDARFCALCARLRVCVRSIADAHRIDWWNLL